MNHDAFLQGYAQALTKSAAGFKLPRATQTAKRLGYGPKSPKPSWWGARSDPMSRVSGLLHPFSDPLKQMRSHVNLSAHRGREIARQPLGGPDTIHSIAARESAADRHQKLIGQYRKMQGQEAQRTAGQMLSLLGLGGLGAYGVGDVLMPALSPEPAEGQRKFKPYSALAAATVVPAGKAVGGAVYGAGKDVLGAGLDVGGQVVRGTGNVMSQFWNWVSSLYRPDAYSDAYWANRQ